jgi:hypothetical protein
MSRLKIRKLINNLPDNEPKKRNVLLEHKFNTTVQLPTTTKSQ